MVNEIRSFTLAINRSDVKRTPRRIFTKKISSVMTKIDESERNGFRIILRKAYWKMRMNEYLEGI
jgi:hypothetical protein